LAYNTISSVDPGSLAEKAGVRQGETVIKVNRHEIHDVLDFKYHSEGKKVVLLLQDENGKTRKVRIKNPDFMPLGLNFEEYLMDKARRCANNCVFCFIDQLPKNLRETLYFKDDDARLSFLQGNYVTLTNLSEREVQRIIDLKISPMNISVHTTNAELRVKMLRNKNAGECLNIMRRFADAGIKMNCQIVCCPGLNDGDELIRTMMTLTVLYPHVDSVSIVPVGITKHRDGLYPLSPVNKKKAKEISEKAWALRHDFQPEHVDPNEAVRNAMRAPEGPIILSEVGDAPPAGAPGDSNCLLKALLELEASSLLWITSY